MKTNILTGRSMAAFAMVLASCTLSGPGVSAADEIKTATSRPSAMVEQNGILVTLDQAKVIRIDHDADTVIIGNPAIADAVLYDRKTLVITGRSFGSTNLLILDDNGELVVDEILRVNPAVDTIVTVHRQTQSYTYSCTPTCRSSVAPGDQSDYFELAVKQSQTRNDFASEKLTTK